MARSWLTFGFGVLVLASPLRLLWARPGAWAGAVFVAWAGLVVAGLWLSRERRG